MFKFLALALCLGFTSARVVPEFNQLSDLLNTHLSQSIEMSNILNTYNTHLSQPIKMSDILNDPPPKTRFNCPSNKTIEPCICNRDTYSGACVGAKVTEQTITNFFTAVRKVNKKSDTDTLNMLLFIVAQTKLKTLSMTPFKNLNVTALIIGDNPQLTTLTASDSSNFDQDVPSQALLTVGGLFLGQNELTDNTIEGFFSQVDRPSLKILWINSNRLQGTLPELVPGLSDMTGLVWLGLDKNQITQISNSPFPNNLLFLTMTSNQIETLGNDAFVFSPYPEDHPYANLTSWILLGKNNLGSSGSLSDIPSNSKISDTAFSKITRPVLLSLDGNSLDTLMSDQFETFLDNSKKTVLIVKDNAFQCDNRMQWLKAKKTSYESRVWCADCENDKGKNIFTTKKV